VKRKNLEKMMDSETSTKLWDLDSTHPDQAELLRASLREVLDPELGLNVIELGLIRDASIRDDELHIQMILTTPYCPYGPALIETTRSKAEETLGLTTKMEMGREYWEPGMMEDGLAAEWGLF
jgi:metal-sulfur cluster biosynthetic enzyme